MHSSGSLPRRGCSVLRECEGGGEGSESHKAWAALLCARHPCPGCEVKQGFAECQRLEKCQANPKANFELIFG